VGAIHSDAGEVFVCAGVESMTRIPMDGFNLMPNPELYERMPEAYISMGETAENVARRYNIGRVDQENLAVESHRKATAARDVGRFQEEIIPIHSEDMHVTQDGCIRSETTLEILSTLSPAFDKEGTVTAGTSSPLTDGAAAVLVCSEGYARKNNLPV